MSAVTDLIGNATSSSYAAPTQYNTWQPGNNNLDTQNNSFNSAVSNNLSQGQAATPGWQSYLSQLTSNPYQTGAQTSANNAGTAYTNVGNAAVGSSANMTNAGNQIYQSGLDPQQALYNQQYQLNQDQTNANQAQRGITNSGYGADLANQSSQEFNTAWQANQLQRQIAGAQGASSAYNSAGQLGTSGAASVAQGGAQPLSTYNSGVSNLGQGLGTYGSGTNQQSQTALSDIMSYLGLGANQSNQQGQFNNQYWNNQNAYTSVENAQNAAMWGDIGNIFTNPMDLKSASFMGMGVSK
jgi:hypothetical protein